MSRIIDIYKTADDKGFCKINFSSKEETFYITYYDNHGKLFFTEDFPNKSLKYVRDAASNWVDGIKKLA